MSCFILIVTAAGYSTSVSGVTSLGGLGGALLADTFLVGELMLYAGGGYPGSVYCVRPLPSCDLRGDFSGTGGASSTTSSSSSSSSMTGICRIRRRLLPADRLSPNDMAAESPLLDLGLDAVHRETQERKENKNLNECRYRLVREEERKINEGIDRVISRRCALNAVCRAPVLGVRYATYQWVGSVTLVCDLCGDGPAGDLLRELVLRTVGKSSESRVPEDLTPSEFGYGLCCPSQTLPTNVRW